MNDINVQLTPNIKSKIESLSQAQNISASEILRRALFLFFVSCDSQTKGNKLAVVNAQGIKVSDVIL